MEKAKKFKLYIGLFYFILVGLFLYYFFELKKNNFFLLTFLFFIFIIVWVLAAGFISPLALFSGFIFGKWLGSLYLIFGMSIGATILYLFANYFLKDLIRNRFLKKFQGLEIKFKKSEFIYLLVYRFIGGIPFAISNVLPCIFNVKTYNFFWATLIGVSPQIFLMCALGSGLGKVIDQNIEAPSLFELIFLPDIYIPLIIFACLVIITIFLRKLFYKK